MTVLLSVLIFLAIGIGFVLLNVNIGRIARPWLPNREKQAIYECGEKTFGSSRVQFDLRFYIVALFYLIFDVEVVLIYPWASVYRDAPMVALLLGLPFLGIIIIGFVYEWWSGSLDWVRQISDRSQVSDTRSAASRRLSELARTDPEMLEDAAMTDEGMMPAANPNSGNDRGHTPANVERSI